MCDCGLSLAAFRRQLRKRIYSDAELVPTGTAGVLVYDFGAEYKYFHRNEPKASRLIYSIVHFCSFYANYFNTVSIIRQKLITVLLEI